jgi:hypothetical protein
MCITTEQIDLRLTICFLSGNQSVINVTVLLTVLALINHQEAIARYLSAQCFFRMDVPGFLFNAGLQAGGCLSSISGSRVVSEICHLRGGNQQVVWSSRTLHLSIGGLCLSTSDRPQEYDLGMLQRHLFRQYQSTLSSLNNILIGFRVLLDTMSCNGDRDIASRSFSLGKFEFFENMRYIRVKGWFTLRTFIILLTLIN